MKKSRGALQRVNNLTSINMAIKQITVAPFSDVFFWAERKKLASWNECCDIFHRTEFFNYRGNTPFELSELEYVSEDEDEDYCVSPKARDIMIAWMKENNLKEITITGA